MKNNLSVCVLFIFIVFITNCKSLLNFFPADYFYYPVIANGYGKAVNIKVFYFNGRITEGEIPPNVKVWEKVKGLNIIYIKIYDVNANLIADYSKEFLNAERKKVLVNNEFWVAYEGGLILVPEEYQKGKDWQKYIESLKKKEF